MRTSCRRSSGVLTRYSGISAGRQGLVAATSRQAVMSAPLKLALTPSTAARASVACTWASARPAHPQLDPLGHRRRVRARVRGGQGADVLLQPLGGPALRAGDRRPPPCPVPPEDGWRREPRHARPAGRPRSGRRASQGRQRPAGRGGDGADLVPGQGSLTGSAHVDPDLGARPARAAGRFRAHWPASEGAGNGSCCLDDRQLGDDTSWA
jgi:hypothetical protein